MQNQMIFDVPFNPSLWKLYNQSSEMQKALNNDCERCNML